MIPNDKTSPLRGCHCRRRPCRRRRCASAVGCSSSWLIQKRRQASATTSEARAEPSRCSLVGEQPAAAGCGLIVAPFHDVSHDTSSRQASHENQSHRYSRQRQRQRHPRRRRASGGRIEFSGPAFRLLWLLGAVALISLPLEATCKLAIEGEPSENSLLTNNNDLNPQINQTTTTTPATLQQLGESGTSHQSKSTTLADRIVNFFYGTTTTTTQSPPTTIPEETATETTSEHGAGAGRDDDDAESCKGLSADDSAEGGSLSDNERLVNLQSCFQKKIRRQLMGATRNGMEIFEKLSLTGGCSASLMSLARDIGQLKSWAFKFLDASAKIPSGMMYGLLSDYGDFDQCLSIRSNKEVSPELEAEEGAFSGKYCLMSLKLNYHVKLEANESAPPGIIEDGVLWDELVRHYWTSKLSKGFQLGMCFPSRCTDDDLNQLYQHVAKTYNVLGEVISCQDSLDLKRQAQPDTLQRAILCCLYALLCLTCLGTLLDRCLPMNLQADHQHGHAIKLARVVLCFSLARNWKRFMQAERKQKTTINRLVWLRGCRTSPPLGGALSSAKLSETTNAQKASPTNNTSSGSSSEDVDFIDSDPDSSSSAICDSLGSRAPHSTSCRQHDELDLELGCNTNRLNEPLTVRVDYGEKEERTSLNSSAEPLAHLSGLKLLIIVWITVGYSFLYPSANNYQYYRSIIKMNLTRDSVWFATTNFTLGIDMLLYITGLLFVYKLLNENCGGRHFVAAASDRPTVEKDINGSEPIVEAQLRCATRDDVMDFAGIVRLISRKALRFWPTYLTVIGFAVLVPLLSDGPMWPEMVSKKLGESCRRNWWANLLFINNYFNQSDICLPSSWFISILMQLFLVGSFIVVLVRRVSLPVGLAVLALLLVASAGISFAFAYLLQVRAPIIKMDESFVMDLEENIFSLYTNMYNNLGPFLVGMAGGFLLLRAQATNNEINQHRKQTIRRRTTSMTASERCLAWLKELIIAGAVMTIAILVLSSVFHEQYSRLAAGLYWSLHRIGWAVVTGYVVHNCATGRWRLLNDLLSLSAFAPLSKLIFIAYLVYPIYIHIHTGLVRDGLHVSIYNMLNIYITRLVMTFVTALLIHLLVEMPFRAIEEIFSRPSWVGGGDGSSKSVSCAARDPKADPSKLHPLLAVVPFKTSCNQEIPSRDCTTESPFTNIPPQDNKFSPQDISTPDGAQIA